MLLNSKRSETRDERPNMAGHELRNNLGAPSRKQLMFLGYAVLGKGNVGKFQNLRIYFSPPFAKDIAATDSQNGQVVTDQLTECAEDRNINRRFNMRQIKEHDLLFLTAERIEKLGHGGDIKSKTSLEFIRA